MPHHFPGQRRVVFHRAATCFSIFRPFRASETCVFDLTGLHPGLVYSALSGLGIIFLFDLTGLHPVLIDFALSGLGIIFLFNFTGLYPVLVYFALSGLGMIFHF